MSSASSSCRCRSWCLARSNLRRTRRRARLGRDIGSGDPMGRRRQEPSSSRLLSQRPESPQDESSMHVNVSPHACAARASAEQASMTCVRGIAAPIVAGLAIVAGPQSPAREFLDGKLGSRQSWSTAADRRRATPSAKPPTQVVNRHPPSRLVSHRPPQYNPSQRAVLHAWREVDLRVRWRL